MSFRLSPSLGLIAVALLAGVAGCKDRRPPIVAQAANGRAPQIFHVGNGTEPQELDPQTVTGIPEHKIIMGLFEGLVTQDAKGGLVPGLAQSWEISPDGKIYTFRLRATARWSDGVPITADDFVQSYRRFLTPALGAEYSYLLWFAVGAEEYNKGKLADFSQVGFRALDERTLQVTLNHPTPFLLKLIACHYVWNAVPVKVIAVYGPLDRKGTGWTRPGRLVGSGPFMLKEWRPNQKIVLVRNPYYWDAATVKLDEIHFYPTEDIATEERMFRAGQLHLTNELPVSKIDVYRRDYPESLHISPYLGVYFYRCNVTRPPLDDKRVRRALALAIDREAIVKNITRGGQ